MRQNCCKVFVCGDLEQIKSFVSQIYWRTWRQHAYLPAETGSKIIKILLFSKLCVKIIHDHDRLFGGTQKYFRTNFKLVTQYQDNGCFYSFWAISFFRNRLNLVFWFYTGCKHQSYHLRQYWLPSRSMSHVKWRGSTISEFSGVA